MLSIDNLIHLSLRPEEEAILKAMFAFYQRLTLKRELGGGFSGARVLLVQPIESEDSRDLPAVVRIAPAALIEKEWQVYSANVRNKLPGIAEITGEPTCPPGSSLGGLRYALTGEGGTFEVENFSVYCKHAAVADIQYVLKDRLFEIIGTHWWLFNHTVPDWPVRACYDFLLPVNLVIAPYLPPQGVTPVVIEPGLAPRQPLSPGDHVRLEGFEVVEIDPAQKTVTLNMPPRPDGLPASFRMRLQPAEATAAYQVGNRIAAVEGRVSQTRHSQLLEMAQRVLGPEIDLAADTLTTPGGTFFPNPLVAMPAVLGKRRTIKVSLIHGDLNMENIMVETQGRNVSLIDFGTARRDYALHDLLRLETEVMIKLVPEAVRESERLPETLFDLYRWVHAAVIGSEPPSSFYLLQADLKKPFETLLLIRHMACQCLFERDKWGEYYEGLSLYLLGALKFKNMDQLSKQVAFWSAAAAWNFVAPVSAEPAPPQMDWRLVQRYLPAILYQARREADCLEHLRQLLRAVVTYAPRHLAIELLQSPRVAHNQGRFLDGTLLFADISGFTALSEKLKERGGKQGAEEIVRVVNSYLDEMLGVLFKHDGLLIKFGGDAMLCLFTGENNGALNAVLAAWEMKRACAVRFSEIEALGEKVELGMKVGSNSGHLFAATVGTKEHMEYLLTGSAAEHTARTESAAQRGDVLVSSDTYRLTQASLEAQEVTEKPGFYRVTDIHPGQIPQAQDSWHKIEHSLSEIKNDWYKIVQRLDALAPYLPAGVLPKLVHDLQGGQILGEHRKVTLLFANFVGMSRVIDAHTRDQIADESGIAGDLSEYFVTMQNIVQHYGGVINKMDLYHQGDKLMVIFGAPMAHEEDVQRAALTALAMQKAIRRLKTTLLTQRIGIHTGFVFAGNVGSPLQNQREYTVIGDTVNLAARLMSKAPDGAIWISEEVLDQIEAGFKTQKLEPQEFKGIAQLVPVHQLVAINKDYHIGRPWRRALGSAMVGRDAHLQTLNERLDDLLSGAGRLIVAIRGEAGVGKSRLIAEWQKRALQISTLRAANQQTANQQNANPLWLSGRGQTYGQKAYGIFVDVLEQMLAFDQVDPEERWYVLSRRVEKLPADANWPDEFAMRLACLGKLLGLDLDQKPDLKPRVEALEAEPLQRQMCLAVRDSLRQAAQDRPLVLVLEDLHQADQASLDMLKPILNLVSQETPILFCLVFRPLKEHAVWQAWEDIKRSCPDYTDIELAELADTDCQQLVYNLLQTVHLPAEFQERLLRETDGNPLYVEEVLNALLEKDIIVKGADGYQLAQAVEHIQVPDTLYQIIQSRIDELDFGSPGARQVLWMAAIAGEEVSEDLLRHLFSDAGEPPEEFDRHLLELRNAGMIEWRKLEGGWRYRFHHGLVRQVAYENMLVAERQKYHGIAGAWIESEYQAELPRHYAALAHHYDQAQEWEKAFQYNWLAGEQEARVYANQEAVLHLRRALEIAGQVTPSPSAVALGQVHFELGKALTPLGEFDTAIVHLENAYQILESASAVTTAQSRAQICYHIGYAYQFKGEKEHLDKALDWQNQGLVLLPQSPTGEAALLHVIGGFVTLRQQDFQRAIEEGQIALALAEKIGAQAHLGVIHRLLSVVYHTQGDLDSAMHHATQGIEVDHAIGDLRGELKGYLNKGVFAFELDDWPAAEDSYQQAISLLQRVVDKYELGKAYANLADLYCHQGKLDEGFDYVHRALDIFNIIQAAPGLVIAHAVLATLCWRQGQWDEALAQLHTTMPLAEGSMFEYTVRRWLAQVYLSKGDLARAETEIQALLSLDVDAPANDLEPVHHIHGEILAAQGKVLEALDVLRASKERLEQQRMRYQMGRLLLTLARVLKQTGKYPSQTLPLAQSAREIFDKLGARLDEQDAEALIARL